MRRIGRREHERALGEVELSRDRLHPCGADPLCVWENGQLVAGERRCGQDIDEMEVVEHQMDPFAKPAIIMSISTRHRGESRDLVGDGHGDGDGDSPAKLPFAERRTPNTGCRGRSRC